MGVLDVVGEKKKSGSITPRNTHADTLCCWVSKKKAKNKPHAPNASDCMHLTRVWEHAHEHLRADRGHVSHNQQITVYLDIIYQVDPNLPL